MATDPELSSRNAKAVVGDLLTEARPSENLDAADLHDFDIAVVGMGFHHFASPALALSRLAERLHPGGVVLIIDFLDEGQAAEAFPSDSRPTVKAHGFSTSGMQKIMEDAGLESTAFRVMTESVELPVHGEMVARKILLARALAPKPDATL